jgi:hypothetical protein
VAVGVTISILPYSGLGVKVSESGYYSGMGAGRKSYETLTKIKRQSNTLGVY